MSYKICRIALSASALLVGVYGLVFLFAYSSDQTPHFSLKYQTLIPFFIYIHFIGGAFSLFTASLQLWLKPGSKLHKWVGYIYVTAVVCGALGGGYLAFYSYLGWSTGVGFLLLDFLWGFSTAYGIYLAITGQVIAHRRWMLRSAAFTFSGVSLRLMIPLLTLFVDFDTAYFFVAWSCWLFNLLIIEIYLRRSRSNQFVF